LLKSTVDSTHPLPQVSQHDTICSSDRWDLILPPEWIHSRSVAASIVDTA